MTTWFTEIIAGENERNLAKKQIECKYRIRMVFTKCKQAVLRTDVIVKRRGKCDTYQVAAEGPRHLFRVQST